LERAAYICGTKFIHNGRTFNHSRRTDVLHREILLPDDAPREFFDRLTLWSTAQAAEKRKKPRYAREILVALPRKTSLQTNIVLVREFVTKTFVDLGMCADFAIHRGDSKDKRRKVCDQTKKRPHNPHAHILLTPRRITPEGFDSVKDRSWNLPSTLVKWREEWANFLNKTLEKKGLDDRVSHKSYKDQGIDREPTKHLGPVYAALERKGIRTKIGDENRAIEARNKQYERKELLHEPQLEHEQVLEISR